MFSNLVIGSVLVLLQVFLQVSPQNNPSYDWYLATYQDSLALRAQRVPIPAALAAPSALAPAPHAIPPPSTSIAPAAEVLATATQTLAIKLIQELHESAGGGNLVLSPYSSALNLALLLEGSPEGSMTYDQIRRVLNTEQRSGLSWRESLRRGFEEFHDAMKGTNGTLSGGSALFTQQSNQDTLKKAYRSLVRDRYWSEVRTVNFENQSEASRQVNEWVAWATRNEIKDLVQPGDISPDTTLAITNAIYYHGKWQQSFNPSETIVQAFYTESGDHIKVQNMHQQSVYRTGFVGDLDSFVLELPFSAGNISMFLVLPHKLNTVQGVISRLRPTSIPLARQRLAYKDVLVSLPKFKISSTIQLHEALQKLGVTDVFSPDADLSEMLEQKGFYVSKTIQKANIDVSEDGAKASAATIDFIVPLIGNPEQFQFIVNRPFLFFILHQTTNTILFSGVITKPDTADQPHPSASGKPDLVDQSHQSASGKPELTSQQSVARPEVTASPQSVNHPGVSPTPYPVGNRPELVPVPQQPSAGPGPDHTSSVRPMLLQTTPRVQEPDSTSTTAEPQRSTTSQSTSIHPLSASASTNTPASHVTSYVPTAAPGSLIGPLTLPPGVSLSKVTYPPHLIGVEASGNQWGTPDRIQPSENSSSSNAPTSPQGNQSMNSSYPETVNLVSPIFGQTTLLINQLTNGSANLLENQQGASNNQSSNQSSNLTNPTTEQSPLVVPQAENQSASSSYPPIFQYSPPGSEAGLAQTNQSSLGNHTGLEAAGSEQVPSLAHNTTRPVTVEPPQLTNSSNSEASPIVMNQTPSIPTASKYQQPEPGDDLGIRFPLAAKRGIITQVKRS